MGREYVIIYRCSGLDLLQEGYDKFHREIYGDQSAALQAAQLLIGTWDGEGLIEDAAVRVVVPGDHPLDKEGKR